MESYCFNIPGWSLPFNFSDLLLFWLLRWSKLSLNSIEKMERQAPLAGPNIDPYALAQKRQMAMQRMQQNGQWQWDKNAPRVSHPVSSQPYSEGKYFS